MRLRIEEDPHRPGEGCARLVLPGMAGREAPFVTFTREGFGADSLGPDGWQVAAGRLTPIESGAEGDDLVLVLGPEAAEHLEPGPVRLGIPALGIDQVVIWPEIAPAQSGKRGGFGANRPGQAQPRRMPGRVEPPAPKAPTEDETVVIRAAPRIEPPPRPIEPPIRAPEAPTPPSRLPLILAALLLLASAGAAAWWFWPAPAPQQAGVTPAPATPAPSDPTATATPAEIAAMNLPPARVLAIGQARQAARPQDALLLIELAADAGHAPAISALARLYDPATFAPGGALSMPNPTKAAELWRNAERAGDTTAAAPRAILRDRLETAARGGDTVAQLALRDFWP
ncbi:hypothetical protein [Falsiroseomonas sp.]|uniref:hypothetical protein n=1 Tax=Falsiroseomonas sp. TaxID=2870721 RepID=UPI003F6FAFF5